MRFLITVLYILLAVSPILAEDGLIDVNINFRGVVGEELFDCEKEYKEIGTTKSTVTISDFRLFINDVRLISDDGAEAVLKLENDGKFQALNIALLDFENGRGHCTNGTPELNTIVKGKAPNRNYTGIKFIVGVPAKENHKDPTLQPSPLNITRMMWSWQSGYKFVRIDMRTTGRPNGYVLHLGSSGCKTGEDQITHCQNGNRSEITLKNFDLKNDAILVDLKALYANSNVDFNQEKTASGCMAAASDEDCSHVFASLGLPFGDMRPKEQTFFRIENAKKLDIKSGTSIVRAKP